LYLATGSGLRSSFYSQLFPQRMLTPDAQLCVTYLPPPHGAKLLAHILTLTLALTRCIVNEIGIRQHIVQSHFRMYFTHSILSNSAPHTHKPGLLLGAKGRNDNHSS
jgi:hypothetical protein